ncbi:MAG TPA: Fis family transcriptional regulator, partial [Anaeromyxobacteraceae bacterium]|nr:Fis family transcriptional regulator [Anaeromyxobacteraceae bacterium]
MPRLDEETVERARRWCAEAGRHVDAADVQAALGGLSWDELLAVKAVLADPPPARPLGPFALVDVARGTPPDLAADRERAGRYRPEPAPPAAAAPDARARKPPPRTGRRPSGPSFVVRRARDRAPPPPPEPPPLPSLETLRAPGGRAVLERLIRRHGARRAGLAAALAQRWR